MYDIIFMSYDEPNADENFARLKERFVIAKRVHGVEGIDRAHAAAAKKSITKMFWVVDADACILDSFEFDYTSYDYDPTTVHVWHSKNPVNGLEYGYGGVKLFSKDMFTNIDNSMLDFTTGVSTNVRVVPVVSNITKFNTSEFSAWRAGFRECVKLSSKLIKNQKSEETEERLHVWCTIGDGDFGEYAVRGANEGAQYGKEYFNQPEALNMINDFGWLKIRFGY